MSESTASQANSWPRGSFGVVLPGFKRTAILKCSDGTTALELRRRWVDKYGSAIKRIPGVASVFFNVVDKERSYNQNTRSGSLDSDDKETTPNRDYDAVTEIFYEDEDAYTRVFDGFGLGAEKSDPEAHVLLTRQVGLREFDRGRPQPGLKRFGFIQKKPGLATQALSLRWRDEHAPLVAQDDTIRKYFIHLTDRRLSATTEWDGYAELWWDGWETYGKGPIGSQVSGVKSPDLQGSRLTSNSMRSLYLFLMPWDVALGRWL